MSASMNAKEAGSDLLSSGHNRVARSGIAVWAIDGVRRTINKDIAQTIITNNSYPLQRKIDRSWVDTLISLSDRGTFSKGTQIVFGVLDNDYYLLDGNHRMHMIVSSNSSHEFQICVEHFDTMDEMRARYGRIDRGRKRSVHAVLKSIDIADVYGISMTAVEGAFRAAVIIGSNMERTQGTKMDPFLKSDDGKLFHIDPWWDQVKLFDEAVKGAKTRIRKSIWSASVLSVALWNFKSNPAKAREFWGGIARDSGLVENDPRKTLSDKLVTTKESWHGQSIIWCAHAWNAWMEGRTLSQINAPPGTKLRLIGSPYTGK